MNEVETMLNDAKRIVARVATFPALGIEITPAMAALGSGMALAVDEYEGNDHMARVLVGLLYLCPDCLRVSPAPPCGPCSGGNIVPLVRP